MSLTLRASTMRVRFTVAVWGPMAVAATIGRQTGPMAPDWAVSAVPWFHFRFHPFQSDL